MTEAPETLPAPHPTLRFEKCLWKEGLARIAGIDEAGRGALAGPVCAGAVILRPDRQLERKWQGVRDSKQMSPVARTRWAGRIQAEAWAWAVGFAQAEEIDSLGIIAATKLAALRAIETLLPGPQALLTDALLFAELDLPQAALIKGDQRSLSVAAASVLAKTTRDALMMEQENRHPGYGFARHKGYGTRLHRLAIGRLGPCPIHRRSFHVQPI